MGIIESEGHWVEMIAGKDSYGVRVASYILPHPEGEDKDTSLSEGHGFLVPVNINGFSTFWVKKDST
ncbi:unnamed protein product [Nippostrongylus brasiliensis]|uniref:SURF1-like protein n=1 Tax=Nippostrongylus brasiliensis TaxID=27835 RepID=A0A0N4XX85_NIPBR|nr:unnamed protein product [Nippostrongylus brasiliensis]